MLHFSDDYHTRVISLDRWRDGSEEFMNAATSFVHVFHVNRKHSLANIVYTVTENDTIPRFSLGEDCR